MNLLEVQHISVVFPAGKAGMVHALRDVSLHIEPGEILGLVGESGCGKSTLARAVVALAPLASGQVVLDGALLNGLAGRHRRKTLRPFSRAWFQTFCNRAHRRRLRRLRPDAQMIFQDPYASLDPRMTVSATLKEAVRARRPLRGAALRSRIQDLMREVGLAPEFIRKYPHEFSGGQRQRIAIARALATEPRLLLADEPVSALDVSIQSQIINLIRRLCREHGLTMLFISHDLSVVHHLADRIAVMYLGRIMEEGPADAVLDAPLHPYTRALISAIPEPDPQCREQRKRIILHGDPPSPMNPPPGCPFHTRCPWARDICAERCPELLPAAGHGRTAACIRLDEL